jgi:hypothetical protein
VGSVMSDEVGAERTPRAAKRPRAEARPAHAAPADPTATDLVANLQGLAGNRAVSAMLQRAPAVQRDDAPGTTAPTTGGLGGRVLGGDQPHLHLDPGIEAQIKAIEAMRTLIAPAEVQGHLLNLNLPDLPADPTPPAPAPATPLSGAPTAPSTATAQGPAPGTGLTGPRAGTGGDVFKAAMSDPAIGPAVEQLGDLAASRAKRSFNNLSTGGKVAVVSTTVVVGTAGITAILSNPSARQLITGTLNDVVIPVPKVPGLGVQLNLSGNNVIVGLHLDVGKILPASLGFGPASQTTPLGAPPGP